MNETVVRKLLVAAHALQEIEDDLSSATEYLRPDLHGILSDVGTLLDKLDEDRALRAAIGVLYDGDSEKEAVADADR